MKPSKKIVISIFFVVGISLLTAIFVVAIQFLYSSSLNNKDRLAFEEYIDVENIYGYMITDSSELANGKSQLDSMMSDEDFANFKENGYVKINDKTANIKNEISFKIDKLFLDIDTKRYPDLIGVLSGLTDDPKVYFEVVTDLSHTVKLCDSIETEKPCIINLTNVESAAISQVALYLKSEKGKNSSYIQVSPDKFIAKNMILTRQEIGKGIVDLEIAPTN